MLSESELDELKRETVMGMGSYESKQITLQLKIIADALRETAKQTAKTNELLIKLIEKKVYA